MFKTHKDALRMEPTPERVRTVCQYIANKSTSRSDLLSAMSIFSDTTQGTIESIRASVRVAEELGLLRTVDGLISFVGNPDDIRTYIGFRRFVASNVLSQKDTTFFKVTEWYLSKNDEVFKYDSWEDKAAAIVMDGVDDIDENDFLGWRFWASFIGEGYLHDRLLIPNMKTRIQDVLAIRFAQSFSYGNEISAMEFLLWIQPHIQEAAISTGVLLPLGFSNGFRTLAELDIISFRTLMDATKVKLFAVEGEPNDFSHVTVKEAIAHELG